MFAVIETGGKQYKVESGTIVDIEKLEGVAQDSISFEKVLLVFDGEKTHIGTPYIEGATVCAKILNQVRDDKITVFKFKRKTGYKRTKGHRQHMTTIRIESIQGQ